MRLKLHKGYWYITFTEEGKTKRRSLRTADRDEAQRLLADFNKRPSGKTVSEIFATYQSDKGGERLEMAWKQLAPHFGQYRPDQVDRARCREYTAYRSRFVQHGTIRRELGILRAALRYADKNTPAVIEMPAQPQPREVWLTKTEFNALYEATTAPHMRTFLMLARHTAARKEAILGLTWGRVDMERNRINFGAGSGNKGRAIVPINGTLHAALTEAFNARTCDYVVEWGGDRVKNIRKGFDSAKAKAGLDHITPHDLRRSSARWMVEAGVPMEEISQYLGHTSTEVTRRVYARFSPDYLGKAAAALED